METKLLQAIEATLLELVVLAGRFVRTCVDLLFRRARFSNYLAETTTTVVDSPYVPPLTFLVVSLIWANGIGLILSRTALSDINATGWAHEVIEYFSKTFVELDFWKIAALMLPVVLVVAAYAWLSSVVAKAMHLMPDFSRHLAIGCYVVGTLYAVVYPLIALNFVFVLNRSEHVSWYIIPVMELFMLLPFYRYLTMLRDCVAGSWRFAILQAGLTYFAFSIMMSPALLIAMRFQSGSAHPKDMAAQAEGASAQTPMPAVPESR